MAAFEPGEDPPERRGERRIRSVASDGSPPLAGAEVVATRYAATKCGGTASASLVRMARRRFLFSGGVTVERIWTTDLLSHAGGHVRLAGWLLRKRQLGAITFLILRDGQGTAQVVVEDPALIERAATLSPESVLAIEGQAVCSEQAPGGIELRAERLEVLVEPTEPPPFDLFRPQIAAQLPTLLDHAPVALRHERLRDRFRLMAAALAGYRRTLDGLGFTEIATPKIVASATESGANVFRLDYFGRPAFLAQSPQFYKQMMVGVRAGLRSRAGLQGRAARHAATPERVPLARCRDGLHSGPYERDGGPDSSDRGHARVGVVHRLSGHNEVKRRIPRPS